MTTWQGAAKSLPFISTHATLIATLTGAASSIIAMHTNATPIAASTLPEISQGFSLGPLVTLFEIDATLLGGAVYRFCSMSENNAIVLHGGNPYPPIACSAEGFDITSQGSLPTPKLRVSNVGGLFGSLVISLKDLVGAQVTRIRTFQQFLDGQPLADPTVHFAPDVFTIQRKSIHNKQMIEWDLSAPLDQENVFLPNRAVFKYNCTQTYRLWNPSTSSFNYTGVTCPFNGSQNGNQSYDEGGNRTTDPNDICGRKDSDCALRFPGQPLPTWAFPGVAGAQGG
jgi:lambda family phage minor tail protein L